MWHSGRFHWKRDFRLYLLITIPLLYFVVFKYIPMVGVIIAFKDYNMFTGIFQSEWVGLSVFREIFGMQDFWRALRNTLMLNLLDLCFMFPAPIFLAVCLNELKSAKYKRVTQTILYLPHFMSWVIVGGIVYQLFSLNTGIVNEAIRSLGFEPVPFLNNKWYWLITYVSAGVWQSAGWDTIIYLAAMTGIDPCLYEAADIDGAGRIQKILRITLPSIKSTIVILLIMKIGQLMGIGFERPYVMGNSLVMDFADVISTYVYRLGLQGGKFSQSTAVGLFQSLVGLVLIAMANFAAKRNGEEGIW